MKFKNYFKIYALKFKILAQLLGAILVAGILIGGYVYLFPKSAQAAWYDEQWFYKQSFQRRLQLADKQSLKTKYSSELSNFVYRTPLTVTIASSASDITDLDTLSFWKRDPITTFQGDKESIQGGKVVILEQDKTLLSFWKERSD